MSKFNDFRRLAGLQTYLPTLKEARESEETLDVGEVPELVGDVTRAMELATSDEVLEGKKIREMKLGITTSTRRDPAKLDTLKDIVAPAKKAPKKGKNEGIFDRFTGGSSKGMKLPDAKKHAPTVQKRTARDPMQPAAVVGYDAKPKKKPVPKGKLNPSGGFYEGKGKAKDKDSCDCHSDED